jgi:exosortase E/protease (VPEID-CTERM system)
VSASPQLQQAALTGQARAAGWNALVRRMALLLLVLGAEALLASLLLDNADLRGQSGPLVAFIGTWGPWAVRGSMAFAALFAAFAALQYAAPLAHLSSELGEIPVRRWLLVVHALALATFAGLSAELYSSTPHTLLPAPLAAAAWLASGTAALGAITLAAAPARCWLQVVRCTGRLWLYALAGAAFACVAGDQARRLWKPATALTFRLSEFFLRPFVSGIVARPDTGELGTKAFTVQIAPQCSGLEGAALLLVFGIFWLIAFRRELRFPQSLLLVPFGTVVLFLLNSARIAALILIGNSGAERVALGGFHSQAGWIAFNSVAIAMALSARRLRWFAAPGALPRPALAPAAPDATAAYLLPFLAILAAGMLTRAVSGDFEWLYGLRVAAAAAALFAFRQTYGRPRCSFDWFALSMGGAVFVLWIVSDRLAGAPAPIAPSLQHAPAALRAAWILARLAGAVVAVPVAEELAFRGYLLRRLTSAAFESVAFPRTGAVAVLASSVAFGLLHGRMWFAGAVAGVLYAFAARRRGCLGDAIVAHATTNLLLAAYVLAFQQWQLW